MVGEQRDIDVGSGDMDRREDQRLTIGTFPGLNTVTLSREDSSNQSIPRIVVHDLIYCIVEGPPRNCMPRNKKIDD